MVEDGWSLHCRGPCYCHCRCRSLVVICIHSCILPSIRSTAPFYFSARSGPHILTPTMRAAIEKTATDTPNKYKCCMLGWTESPLQLGRFVWGVAHSLALLMFSSWRVALRIKFVSKPYACIVCNVWCAHRCPFEASIAPRGMFQVAILT